MGNERADIVALYDDLGRLLARKMGPHAGELHENFRIYTGEAIPAESAAMGLRQVIAQMSELPDYIEPSAESPDDNSDTPPPEPLCGDANDVDEVVDAKSPEKQLENAKFLFEQAAIQIHRDGYSPRAAEAEAALLVALANNLAKLEVLYMLGRLYSTLRRHDEAISSLIQVVSVRSGAAGDTYHYPKALKMLAACYRAKGDFLFASYWSETLVEYDDSDADAVADLIRTYEALGQLEMAAQFLEQAREDFADDEKFSKDKLGGFEL